MEQLANPADVPTLAMGFQNCFDAWVCEVRVGDDPVGKAAGFRPIGNRLHPFRLPDRIGVVVLRLHVDGLDQRQARRVPPEIREEVVLPDGRVVAADPRPDPICQPRIVVRRQVPEVMVAIDDFQVVNHTGPFAPLPGVCDPASAHRRHVRRAPRNIARAGRRRMPASPSRPRPSCRRRGSAGSDNRRESGAARTPPRPPLSSPR